MIEKGAVPVNFFGAALVGGSDSLPNQINENENSEEVISIEEKIKSLVENKSLTAEEIKTKLNLDWNLIQLNSFLKTLDFLIVKDDETIQESLF